MSAGPTSHLKVFNIISLGWNAEDLLNFMKGLQIQFKRTYHRAKLTDDKIHSNYKRGKKKEEARRKLSRETVFKHFLSVVVVFKGNQSFLPVLHPCCSAGVFLMCFTTGEFMQSSERLLGKLFWFDLERKKEKKTKYWAPQKKNHKKPQHWASFHDETCIIVFIHHATFQHYSGWVQAWFLQDSYVQWALFLFVSLQTVPNINGRYHLFNFSRWFHGWI